MIPNDQGNGSRARDGSDLASEFHFRTAPVRGCGTCRKQTQKGEGQDNRAHKPAIAHVGLSSIINGRVHKVASDPVSSAGFHLVSPRRQTLYSGMCWPAIGPRTAQST